MRQMRRRLVLWSAVAASVAGIAVGAAGVLPPAASVGLVAGLEAMAWTGVAVLSWRGVRRFRSARRIGVDGWRAAEDGLSVVVPRRVARLVILEPRLWSALVTVTRRRRAASPDAFAYAAGTRTLFGVLVAVVCLEGAVVEVLVWLFVPGTTWFAVVLALHLYALVLLLGLWASFVTRPHEVASDGLHVRDGVFAELLVSWSAIRGARGATRSNVGRSGFKTDGAEAVLALGDATVAIELDPNRPLLLDGRTVDRPLHRLWRLWVTADEPRRLVERLRSRPPVAPVEPAPDGRAAAGSGPTSDRRLPPCPRHPPPAVGRA